MEPRVSLITVGELRRRLREYSPPPQRRQQWESQQRWRPLYERLLEQVALTRRDDWPFQDFPEGWQASARPVIEELQGWLRDQPECHYPQRETSNVRRLAQAVQLALEDPARLTGREVGWARRILLDSEQRWGGIATPQRRQRLLGDPPLADFQSQREALWTALAAYPPEGGLPETFLDPIPNHWPLSVQRWIQLARQTPLSRGFAEGLPGRRAEVARGLELWARQPGPDPKAAYQAAQAWAWRTFPEEDFAAAWKAWATVLPLDWRGSEEGSEEWLESAWQGTRQAIAAARGRLYADIYALPEQPPESPSALWRLAEERALQRFGGPSHRRRTLEEVRLLSAAGLWSLWPWGPPPLDLRSCADRLVHHLGRTASQKERGSLYGRQVRHRRWAHGWQRLVFCLSWLPREQAVAWITQREPSAPPSLAPFLAALRTGSGAPWSGWLASGGPPASGASKDCDSEERSGRDV